MWVDFLAGIGLGDTSGCSASLRNNDRFVKLVHTHHPIARDEDEDDGEDILAIYLLRTTMMMVLEMTVMQARMGMMMPRRG